jgi:APA family basic amino acid/polyamine antiporter
MRFIVGTYDGWQDTVYHCEELQRPERTLPRSFAIGIVSVAILYLLVNVALLHVLSPAQMATSILPAADAARLVLGQAGETLLTGFGILSVLAITNLNTMRSARIAYAMARQGQLPAKLSDVASSGTPRAALSTSVVLAAVIAASGTYETIVAMNVALTVSLVVAVNLAAMRLRRREPDLVRPFRIPLYPLPVIVAVAINLSLLAAMILEDPLHSLAGLAVLCVIGMVYSLIAVRRQRSVHKA